MTLPAGYAPASVPYQFTIRNTERDAVLNRLFEVPSVWRSRISVVFVDDDTPVVASCMDLWPKTPGFQFTRYQDVLDMLLF